MNWMTPSKHCWPEMGHEVDLSIEEEPEEDAADEDSGEEDAPEDKDSEEKDAE